MHMQLLQCEVMNPAAEMNQLHDEICGELKMTIAKAIRIGELLVKQKEICGHGNWLPWIKANLKFTDKSAERYMKAFDKRSKFDTVSNMSLVQFIEDAPSSEEEAPTDNEPKLSKSSLVGKIYAVMNDGAWRTLQEIEELTGERGDTARLLRFLREPEFGSYMVELRARGRQKEYRVLNSEPKTVDVAPITAKPDHKTGKTAPPEERVPEVIMRKIISPDMVGKGFRTCSDIRGEPCQLVPNVSELEFKERAAFSIAGDETFKCRKAHAKWDQYEEQKIRPKLLKVLELMSPLSLPPVHRSKAITYVYNLGTASDLRELAEMVSADLLRAADTLELQEKYGHIQWSPGE